MSDGQIYRMERIVACAIDMIYESGINSVSTKVIAERLALSESTIFKHFPKKADLLRAVLDQLSIYDQSLYQTVRSMDPRGAISYYIDGYMAYYENYPAITSLMFAYELFRGMGELEDKAMHIHKSRLGYMKDLIESAQHVGFVNSRYSSTWLAHIFMSTFDSTCVRWRIGGANTSLRAEAREIFDMLLNTFATDK